MYWGQVRFPAPLPGLAVYDWIVSWPGASLGALAGLWIARLTLSIYAQIGLVLLVGIFLIPPLYYAFQSIGERAMRLRVVNGA